MPAESQSQARLMNWVHAVQKGEAKGSGKVNEIAHEMKPSSVEHFMNRGHINKKLPKHVKKAFENGFIAAYEKYAKDLSPGHAARNHVPKSEFAMPGKHPKGHTSTKGKYPMPDKAHERAALGFAAMHHGKGSAEYKAVAHKAHELFGKNAHCGIGEEHDEAAEVNEMKKEVPTHITKMKEKKSNVQTYLADTKKGPGTDVKSVTRVSTPPVMKHAFEKGFIKAALSTGLDLTTASQLLNRITAS